MSLRLHKVMPWQLADETADFLRASTLFAWATIFNLQLPASPTNAIAVVPTGGIDRPDQPLSYIRVQILVRATGGVTNVSKAETVWKELTQSVRRFPGSDGRFIADHLPGPFYIDANNVRVFTLNFTYQGLSRVA